MHHLISSFAPLWRAFLVAVAALSGTLFLSAFLSAAPASGQTADDMVLLTRAERTDYLETTRYDEVVAFLETAVSRHPRLHLTNFGYTVEGRALPLVVFGDVANASPYSVLATRARSVGRRRS